MTPWDDLESLLYTLIELACGLDWNDFQTDFSYIGNAFLVIRKLGKLKKRTSSTKICQGATYLIPLADYIKKSDRKEPVNYELVLAILEQGRFAAEASTSLTGPGGLLSISALNSQFMSF